LLNYSESITERCTKKPKNIARGVRHVKSNSQEKGIHKAEYQNVDELLAIVEAMIGIVRKLEG
jgi:hypothetical protein